MHHALLEGVGILATHFEGTSLAEDAETESIPLTFPLLRQPGLAIPLAFSPHPAGDPFRVTVTKPGVTP